MGLLLLTVLMLACPGPASATVPAHPDSAAVKKICAAVKPLPARSTAAAKAARAAPCATAKSRLQDDKDATKLILVFSLVGATVILLVFWVLGHLVIGADGRLSTSKTIAASWSALLAGSLFAFVVAKLGGQPQALRELLHSGLAGQYGLLIGGPLGAAIAAKGIVSTQVAKDSTAKQPVSAVKKSRNGQPKEQDKNPFLLFLNDAGQTDLGDFQYVLFNLVAMVFFVGSAIQDPLAGLPTIPDVLLGLTSVSAVGYVTKKALPPGAATAKLDKSTAAVGETVKIVGQGLLTSPEPSETPIMVLFGDVQVVPGGDGKRRDGTGVDTISVTVPDGLLKDQEVEVYIINPAPSRVLAGSFKVK